MVQRVSSTDSTSTPTASTRPKRLSYISPVRDDRNGGGFLGTGYVDSKENNVVQRAPSPNRSVSSPLNVPSGEKMMTISKS